MSCERLFLALLYIYIYIYAKDDTLCQLGVSPVGRSQSNGCQMRITEDITSHGFKSMLIDV